MIPPFKTPICIACMRPLTGLERWAYDYRCQDCEEKEMARLERWRASGEDKELDALYSGDLEKS